MASSSSVLYFPTWKSVAVVLLLLSLSFAPSKSEGSSPSRSLSDFRGSKSVLGSRPPACNNKCSSCRPCMATLVIPPHHERNFILSQADDSTYYLLIWKCRCGNKLFHP
ncbi:unnamed protein product [Victoria cruziana]